MSNCVATNFHFVINNFIAVRLKKRVDKVDKDFAIVHVVTGDLDVGSTAGELYVGPGARTDAETLGTVTKTAQTKSLTNNIATITTSTAHGFAPFQFVTIALSPADAAFDGTYEILTTPTLNTFTFAKTAGNIASQATVGTVTTIPGYTNAAAVFAIDADDDFAQIAFRNSGNGTNSSTDYIAYADNGTDFAGYIDMGITSSNFNDPEFTITGANDGYIFLEAPVGTTGRQQRITKQDCFCCRWFVF